LEISSALHHQNNNNHHHHDHESSVESSQPPDVSGSHGYSRDELAATPRRPERQALFSAVYMWIEGVWKRDWKYKFFLGGSSRSPWHN
jgi:hypothetical protein